MTDHAIEAVGLSKRFLMATERRTSLKERLARGKSPTPKTFWALQDATFSVARGSSLGIVGHNGSGKSTALKVLTGIYRPTSGTVRVNGSVSALLEVGAGFHPELTGRENVRLNATILGFTNREIDRFMDQIIEFSDLGDFIDSPIKHYSSGMYLRLGFAVAVMVRPDILIVDEVIAVGDEEFQRKCYDHLHGLRKSGTTMVIVSHGMGNIIDLCDEALWLAGGQVRRLGPSREVTRAYLDEVNARESARTAANGGLSPSRAVMVRRGSGEIRVTAVELLGPDGSPRGVLISGEAVTVRIHYQAGQPVQDVVFSMSMENHAGIPVLGASSRESGPWRIPAGQGHADFQMDSLLLVGGTYELKTAVHVESSVIDAIDDGYEVVVRSTSVDPGGLFVQPGQWLVMGSERAEDSAVSLHERRSS